MIHDMNSFIFDFRHFFQGSSLIRIKLFKNRCSSNKKGRKIIQISLAYWRQFFFRNDLLLGEFRGSYHAQRLYVATILSLATESERFIVNF